MIDQIVRNIVATLVSIGHELWSHTIGLLDPFWGYLLDGIIIIAACVAAGWFFSFLRPIAGIITTTVIAFLVGFWKGENKEKRR